MHFVFGSSHAWQRAISLAFTTPPHRRSEHCNLHAHCGGCPSQHSTLRWIDEFVIGQRLCPWASESRRSPAFHLVTIGDASQFVEATVAAAAELASSSSSLSLCPTTLLVLDDRMAQSDVAHFAGLCRQASVLAARAAPSVDLLGFHPARIDRGPGCSANAEDAAHYSVRSPLPTVQLLRRADLDAARRDYAARRSPSALPGALGLLYENKRRLRKTGSDVLREQLRAWQLQDGVKMAAREANCWQLEANNSRT